MSRPTSQHPRIGVDDALGLLASRAGRLKEYVSRRIPSTLSRTVSPEDVLQEIWVAVFRGIRAFHNDHPDAFDKWVTTIANRELLDVLKTERRLRRGGGLRVQHQADARRSSLVDLFEKVASPQRTPSQDASAKEAACAIQLTLSSLSESRRRAIWMRHIEGRSVLEIARVLKKSIPAVHSLIFKGLRQMRDRIGDAGSFFSDVGSSE